MKLTKRAIDRAVYQGPGADYRWDEALPAFGLRVYPSGCRSFVATYRCRGRQRFYTIGRYGEMTLAEARAEALKILGCARQGEDPAAERAKGWRAPTVKDLWERYRREHVEVRLKPSTQRKVCRRWRERILPRFGRRKVSDISRDDVARLMADLAATPMAANEARKHLSSALTQAEAWGWRPEGSNPCRHVKPYPEESRERFLSEAELGRLADALVEVEEERPEWTHGVAAIRLLLLTGCRKGEILALRWEEVDLERRSLNLPDSKSGRKTVYLNAAALQVLAGVPRVEGNPYVVPGGVPGAHLTHLERPWEVVRERAGIKGVRIHDLRHTFASVGVGSGLSLPVIGRLLGHARAATTERYTHLADDPVRQAAERIGDSLMSAMEKRQGAEVVSLAPGSEARQRR